MNDAVFNDKLRVFRVTVAQGVTVEAENEEYARLVRSDDTRPGRTPDRCTGHRGAVMSAFVAVVSTLALVLAAGIVSISIFYAAERSDGRA